MGSLAHCLKKHNVSPELEREIRDRAAELRAEGYTAQQASVEAVKDRLDTLRSQRADVMAQVKSAQPARAGKISESKAQQSGPGFKAWFKGSKIVDENGDPMVLYHGTHTSFDVFKPSKEGALGAGIYMTPNAEHAGIYSENEGGNIMPLYASIANPLVIAHARNQDPMIVAFEQLGMSNAAASKLVEKAYEEKGYITGQLKSRAQKAGYDGLVQKVDGIITEVVAFDKTQVKSATGNNGDYNPFSGKISEHRGQESTPEFIEWFGDSKVVDAQGNPMRLYHGTVHDFDSFDPSRGWVEGYFGAGIYMTDTIGDANENYATRKGADLLNKIRDKAEALMDERNETPTGGRLHQWGTQGYKNMYRAIEREVIQKMAPTGGVVMPLYARIEKPFEIGGKNETRLTAEPVEDEEGLTIDMTGPLVDFQNAVADVADEFGVDVMVSMMALEEYAYDGVATAEQILDALDTNDINELSDDDGNLIGREFIRSVIERAGFDGIIDHKAYRRFHMKGMTDKTTHYIAFSNTQVKSYTGNDGSFDNLSGKISNSIVGGPKNPKFRKWFKKSYVVDENGKPKVVYHGTKFRYDFDEFMTHNREMGAHFGSKSQAADFVDTHIVHLGEGQYRYQAPRIYPVYLSIQNPLRLVDEGDFTAERVAYQLLDLGIIDEEKYQEIGKAWYDQSGDVDSGMVAAQRITQEAMKEAGYDGIVYRNRAEGFNRRDWEPMDIYMMSDEEFASEFPDAEDSWIVFDPWQIKSATSNTGEYSTLSGKINEHRQPNAASWHAPAITSPRWENIVFNLQDKHLDTKKVIAAINESRGAPVPEQQDVYLQEELFHGRAAKMSEDFLNRELKPLLQDMALRKVTLDEFEKFLHNRHAKERNEQIARVNPKMPDGGSGIKTADALRYLNTLPADKRTAYTALARRIDAMIARTNQLLVSETLESQTTIDNWNRVYKNYVPLHREDMGDGNVGGTGQGYTVKGPASKRATGSELPVENILANIAVARERTITRGAKNKVSTALVNLALANRNPAFWDVDAPETIKFIGPSGIVVESIDPLWKNRPNVVVARMKDSNGNIVEHGVVFNKRNERAMRMAEALKNLSTPELSAAIGLIAKATRYFASINTQYNPIFGVVNITRDMQQLMFNLTTTAIAGKQLAVAKNIIPALIGVYRDLRASRKGRPARSAWAQTYEEFEKSGGQTGYRDMFVTPQERTENLIRELKHMGGGAKEAPRAIARWLGGWLSDYNTAMENATRLAAYKVARDSGLSTAKAADIAKNLTVNFNRKGNVSSQVGALWAFFNASAQGTARLVETMRGPKGKMIIAGGVLAGVLQAFALAAAGFDDDDPPDFVRQRSFIIPLGGKRYITIPMPLGLNMLPNLGRVATELVLTGGRNAADKTLGLATLIFDTFSPIGGGASVAQIASPTLFDPAVALLENKDWTGKPIERPDMNPLDPSPGHERAKERATPWGVWLSEGINQLTGGTEYQPGRLSPTPDAIDYVIGQVTGGVGREISKLAATLSAAATGEDLPAHKVPLVGRFYGKSEGQSKEGDAFYRNVIEINKHEREIKGRAEEGKDIWDYIERHPTADLVKEGNKYQRDVAKLRKARRELVKEGAPKDEVASIEAEITDFMREFNDLVKEYRSR